MIIIVMQLLLYSSQFSPRPRNVICRGLYKHDAEERGRSRNGTQRPSSDVEGSGTERKIEEWLWAMIGYRREIEVRNERCHIK